MLGRPLSVPFPAHKTKCYKGWGKHSLEEAIGVTRLGDRSAPGSLIQVALDIGNPLQVFTASALGAESTALPPCPLPVWSWGGTQFTATEGDLDRLSLTQRSATQAWWGVA